MSRHRFVPPPPQSTPQGIIDPVRVLRRRPRCRCGKVAARSRVEVERLFAEVSRHRGGSEPVMFYRCSSDRRHWHWTRKIEEKT